MNLGTAMARAFELAAHEPDHVFGTNPRVGCVLMSIERGAVLSPDTDGDVIGEGWHRGAGTSHAEVAALADARTRGCLPADSAAGHDHAAAQDDWPGESGSGAGDTACCSLPGRGILAVVTLEPCNHEGKTGPCSHALAEAGVTHVVYAMADPNPVASGGATWLNDHGIEAKRADQIGLMEAAKKAETLNERWLSAVRHARPYVIGKIAQTIDGKIAAADGTSQWITGPQSLAHSRELRAHVDAIAVGTHTVITDNPALTARNADGTLCDYQPLRIVLGASDMPSNAKIFAHAASTRAYERETIRIPSHDPVKVLDNLHQRDIRSLLIEGGATVLSAFLVAHLIDELHVYLAPKILGAGLDAIPDLGIPTLTDAITWQTREVTRLGDDIFLKLTSPKWKA